MRVYLTSYATANFQKVQRDLNCSALQWGVSNILSYNEGDLHTSDFYQHHKALLDEICGAGYWAWKPYFIAQSLKLLEEGDVLLYCDSGTTLINSPEILVKLCHGLTNGVMLFDARPLKNRQFTKRDCFIKMGCDEAAHWDATKVIATVLLLRKCKASLAFVEEWLHFSQDRAIISDDPSGQPELPEFQEHRHDQAILSVLASKYSLETFRNPSFWGNFLKMPLHRVSGEVVMGPYYLCPEITTYSDVPQPNSPYGTIFVVNRQPNYVGKKSVPPVQKSVCAVFLERAIKKLKKNFAARKPPVGEAPGV